MTLLPDVTSLTDEVHVETRPEAILEKAEVAEWASRLNTFQAKLSFDQAKCQEIAHGMDVLKDTLEWINTDKHVKMALQVKSTIEAYMAKHFPTVTVNDLTDLPGHLAEMMLARSQGEAVNPLRKADPRLLILALDFNVPGVSQAQVPAMITFDNVKCFCLVLCFVACCAIPCL